MQTFIFFYLPQKTNSLLKERLWEPQNEQYISNDITLFVFDAESDVFRLLILSVDSWQTVREQRDEARERGANLCDHMLSSDLSSRKLGPAVCW